MKILLILSLWLIGVQATEVIDTLISNEWTVFKTAYNKKYSEDEDVWRLQIYKENRDRIIRNNQKRKENKVSFHMNLNHMADNLRSEMNLKNGLLGVSQKGLKYVPQQNANRRSSVDWRSLGRVTAVRDQGYCGCCYAISAAQAVEGQMQALTGKIYPLAIQSIIDCSDKEGNKGCDGGLMTRAFNYMIEDGLESEQDYPYMHEQNQCKVNKNNFKVSLSNYVNIEPRNEPAIEEALDLHGPLAAALDASKYSFLFYKGGIYFDSNCSSTDINHGVLLVGYGTDPTIKTQNPKLANSKCNGADYWIVKNSWGTDWGINGYFKIVKGCNHCGIAALVSYPIINASTIQPTSNKFKPNPFSSNIVKDLHTKYEMKELMKLNINHTIFW